MQMTVLTAKDEAEVTFEALARTCAKVEESTKDFAALEKARGGGKKVNGITNGEALSAAAKKEANTTPRPSRNEVTKAENGDQWKPGFCRDCFKDQRLYFPWRSHGYKCSHAVAWENSKPNAPKEEKPTASNVNWTDPEEVNLWINQLPSDIAEDVNVNSIVGHALMVHSGMSENAIVDMGATVSCEPDDRNAIDGSVRKSSGQSVLVADGKSAAITARLS